MTMSSQRRSGVPSVVLPSCAPLLLVFVAGLCVGCQWIARQMAMSVADTSLEKSMSIRVGLLPDFWNCFTSKGGACPDNGSKQMTGAPPPLHRDAGCAGQRP
jgi:hypothetical protein